MIFIKNFKLICISLLSLGMYTQARSVSYSQIGDVQIVVTDDKWQCDKIECPLNAYLCFVAKSNEENPSVLKRVNICYSQNNEILVQNISTSAVDPNTKIRQQISSTRNGIISSTNSFNGSNKDFDEKKFNEDLNRDLTKLQANLHSQMADLNKGLENNMKNLNANLNKINENINVNVQGQMQNLQENLSKMQFNLMHMFD